MAEVYGPFFSGSGASFNETQWREFFGNIVTPGVIKGALVNGAAGNNLSVTAPGGMNVAVGTGVAAAYGFFYENDASNTKAITASDATLNRIDSIVIQLLFASRTVLATVINGTLAASPVPPTLTKNSTTWQILLANVTVGHGVSSIVTGNIDNTVANFSGTIAPSLQGTGSGLNADLLDGLNSSAFVLGSGASQHIVVVNRTPTNSDGVDGDLIFQW